MAASWIDYSPVYKLFIQNFMNCKKYNNSWVINFDNISSFKALNQFQLQVTVLKMTGFNNEIMIVTDGTGKAKITRGNKVPGDFSWIKTGALCSIIGTLIENGKLPHVDVGKIAPVENPLQQEMWPLEVVELHNFIINKVIPRLES